MRANRLKSFVRGIIKKVPTARLVYRIFLREQARLRRVIVGPDRGEMYDKETFRILRRALRRDSVCIDVGAHVGQVLREMVAVAPLARHHAVEALPHLASRLRTEFPSVEVHACAVSDEAGERIFNHVEDAPAFSGLRKRRYERDDVLVSEIPVKVSRIDDLIDEDVPVRLIKMDIEGGEYHALLGARATLLRCKPIVIFEFGLGAADYYKVTPVMMYQFLSGDVGLRVSTMSRWLSGQPPYDLTMFADSFSIGTDFYFIAYPDAAGSR